MFVHLVVTQPKVLIPFQNAHVQVHREVAVREEEVVVVSVEEVQAAAVAEAVGDILNTAFYSKIIVCIQKNAELRKRIY